jgi:hypothetical protein
MPSPAFTHTLISRRDLNDPDFAKHLEQFVGYVMSHVGGQMTRTAYHVMRHIQRVQHQISFSVDDPRAPELAQWALAANVILYLPDGTVRDPESRVLVDRTGKEADPAAELPYPRDACERKNRTDTLLKIKGIRVPTILPPVIGAPEVRLRAPDLVARRSLALFVVAVRAESMASNAPIPLSDIQARCSIGFASLTTAERRFLTAAAPPQQDIVGFVWRYEALALLQWALGLTETLPYPTSICDVPATAQLAIDSNNEEFIRSARLRPVDEVLDALDLHFRLNWAVTQARTEQKSPPGTLDGGVVYERHRALNWLVRFENKDWDDVETPT